MEMKKIYFDGACLPKNPGGVACYGVVAVNDDGNIVDKRFGVVSENGTNNIAEWAGLIHAIKLAKELNWDGVHIYGDSQLAVNQFNDLWRVSKEHLKRMYDLAKKESEGVNITVEWIPREENLADDVAYEAYVNYTGKLSKREEKSREEKKMKARKVVLSNCVSSQDGEVLHCPNCGYERLHYATVEIFNRRCEDKWYGLHCVIDGTNMEVDIDASTGNPSERRNGIKIKFLCENCGCSTWLHILQHKGSTFIGWNPVSFSEDRVDKTTNSQINKEVSHEDSGDKRVLDIFGE